MFISWEWWSLEDCIRQNDTKTKKKNVRKIMRKWKDTFNVPKANKHLMHTTNNESSASTIMGNILLQANFQFPVHFSSSSSLFSFVEFFALSLTSITTNRSHIATIIPTRFFFPFSRRIRKTKWNQNCSHCTLHQLNTFIWFNG